jgi:predicted RNA polymerase sigma factor
MHWMRRLEEIGWSEPEKQLAVRADLLGRLGRSREAAALLLKAAIMAPNAAARESLRRRAAAHLLNRRTDRDQRLAS